MGTATLDQLLIRRIVADTGTLWKLSDYGIRLEFLTEDAQDAWEFIDAYRRDNGEMPPDEVIVAEMDWDEVGLDELPNATIRYLAGKVKVRTIDNMLSEIVEEVDYIREDSDDESVFMARRKLIEMVDELRRVGESAVSAVNVFDLYPEVGRNYDRYKAGEVGIETPWETMTNAIQGFQMGHVVYFCARPMTGKTWALLKCALHMHEDGHKILFVSPELAETEIAERLACMQLRVSYSNFTAGKLDSWSEKKLREGIEEFKDRKNFIVSDSTMTFDKDEVEHLVNQFDPDIVCLDSIYCFGDGRNRNEQIADASPWTVRLARTVGRPRLVVATAQMNRKATTAETTVMENIYGSDAIGQDSHVVYGLFQDDNMVDERFIGMKQIKVRRGNRHDPFYCRWDFDAMDFNEKPGGKTGYEREEDDDDDTGY